MFSKRILSVAGALILISLLFAACQPETVEIVKTVVVTEEVMVEGTPVVKEVVKEVVITATPDEDLADAARTMTKHGFVRLPVVSLGKLVGIITDREIAKLAPAAIEILRERLLIQTPGFSEETNSGECQLCANYSEELHNVNDRWVCDSCKEEAAEI